MSLKTEKLQFYRDKAARSWNKYNFLSNTIANDISDRILMLNRNFNRCLVIGAHDGYLIDKIALKCKYIVATDISPEFLKKVGPKANALVISDLDNLPFNIHQFDLIVSFLNFHLVTNINWYLFRLNALLNSNGVMFGAHYGDTVMHIIKSNIYGNIPRATKSVSSANIANLLQIAGGKSTLAIKRVEVIYSSFLKMVQDIRGMGETLLDNNPFIRKQQAMAIKSNNSVCKVPLEIGVFMSEEMKQASKLIEI